MKGYSKDFLCWGETVMAALAPEPKKIHCHGKGARQWTKKPGE